MSGVVLKASCRPVVFGVTLSECPFCGGEIDEDIVTFGGSCPKCFAEIPGEEAATDPGEAVKSAQDRADRRRMTFKALIPIALAMPFIFALGCAALWFAILRPAPEVALLDFDEFEAYHLPDIIAVTEPEKLAANEPRPQPRNKHSGSNGASKYAQGTDVEFKAGTADLGSDAAPTAVRGSRGTRGGADGPADNVAGGRGIENVGAGSSTDFGLSVGASRRGGALSDPAAIKQMIFDRMGEQLPRLNGCYEQELKRDDTVHGKWRIRYTIQTDGTVKNAGATGIDMHVDGFEACMAREVGKWRFQRLKNPQPVQKTITFRARR